MFVRTPSYVDRILKRTNLCDVPIDASDEVRARDRSQDRCGARPDHPRRVRTTSPQPLHAVARSKSLVRGKGASSLVRNSKCDDNVRVAEENYFIGRFEVRSAKCEVRSAKGEGRRAKGEVQGRPAPDASGSPPRLSSLRY